MSSAKSLGEMLSESKTKFETDKMYAMKMKLEKESADAQEKIDNVTDFFNRAKTQFSIQITNGRAEIKPMVLSSRKESRVYTVLTAWNWNNKDNNIMDSKNPYNPIWVEFEEWCYGNGLKPKFEYCHDGVGVESWHELNVVPKL